MFSHFRLRAIPLSTVLLFTWYSFRRYRYTNADIYLAMKLILKGMLLGLEFSVFPLRHRRHIGGVLQKISH